MHHTHAYHYLHSYHIINHTSTHYYRQLIIIYRYYFVIIFQSINHMIIHIKQHNIICVLIPWFHPSCHSIPSTNHCHPSSFDICRLPNNNLYPSKYQCSFILSFRMRRQCMRARLHSDMCMCAILSVARPSSYHRVCHHNHNNSLCSDDASCFMIHIVILPLFISSIY